jgi:hypothetical protein
MKRAKANYLAKRRGSNAPKEEAVQRTSPTSIGTPSKFASGSESGVKLADIMHEEQASQAALKHEMFGMLEEMRVEEHKQEQLMRGAMAAQQAEELQKEKDADEYQANLIKERIKDAEAIKARALATKKVQAERIRVAAAAKIEQQKQIAQRKAGVGGWKAPNAPPPEDDEEQKEIQKLLAAGKYAQVAKLRKKSMANEKGC